MPYTEAMLPCRPVIDRAIAFYLFEKAIGRPLKIRFVSQNVHLSNDDIERLSGQGIFTIGVGSGLKYTDRGFGSETSAILHELRSVGKIPGHDPVLDDLARMMDINNDHHSRRGGYLRRQPYAITWIMRQAYRLGHDADEADFAFTDEDVVHRGVHVAAVYIEASRRNERLGLGLREQIIASPAMQLLPEGGPNKGPRNHQGPMTVSRYVRDMFLCCVSEDKMLERTGWFVRVHDRAQARQTTAKEMAKSQSFETFPIDDRDEVGTWVDSDDPYLLEELAKSCPLVVMRRSTGNVIIMSKDFNLSSVADMFLREEPEQWYYQSKPQLLANGTENVDADSSGLSRDTIQDDIGFLLSF
ncbi:MAG: hypothetical protein G01um101466_748 [Parcubacteria group bacterium Gr01-1014_66]|nr:MAG: hypothetical protein G01um101466_748 [Parcubacteria group bacterium Gr01-1014_66]